jgi:TolB protein
LPHLLHCRRIDARPAHFDYTGPLGGFFKVTTKRFSLLAAFVCCGPLISAGPAGVFEKSSDVGTVLNAGSVEYDAAKKTYTVAGSGENMWAAADAFQYVWKRASGDVTLSADIAFIGTGGNAHRKAVLMVRQSLDADSVYVDAAVHGVGLTSIQAREEKGGTTHEVQANITAPKRLRLEKRGDIFYMLVAGEGEQLRLGGGSKRIVLKEPFYVGIGVCAHDPKVVEKAVFSNVELVTGPPAKSKKPALYSTLEVVPVSTTDCRTVWVGPGVLNRRTGPRMARRSCTTATAASIACRRPAGSRRLSIPASPRA